jgi:membrane dipeptidase
MLIFDAHLDLAMNALEWNRDFSRPVEEIRGRERGMTDRPDRERGTVSFAEMRRGRVGLCVATQIARYVHVDNPLPGWHSPEQAWAMTQGQLAWYREMEARGELIQVRDAADLDRHLQRWGGDTDESLPIGALRSGDVCARHGRRRRDRRPRARAAARDGAARCDPRCDASL